MGSRGVSSIRRKVRAQVHCEVKELSRDGRSIYQKIQERDILKGFEGLHDFMIL